MMLTIKELVSQAKTKNFKLFTDSNVLQNLTLPHILENGGVEITYPVWMTAISSITHPEEILNRRYGGLVCVYDDLDVNEYRTAYESFLEYVNESMYRYYDLFLEKIRPYDNVFEHNVEKTEYAEHVTDSKFGETNETTTLDERVNETDYGGDTVTSTDKRIGQDSTRTKDSAINETKNLGKKDTTTLNKGTVEDKVKVDEHTDTVTDYAHDVTVTRDRNGNVGTVSSATMANEFMDLSDKMKFIQLFLDQWIDYFTVGVWK